MMLIKSIKPKKEERETSVAISTETPNNYFIKSNNKKEERKMKKVLFLMLLVLVVAFAFYGTADAISGVCSGCHTMHDSQDGSQVSDSGPNDQLLLSSCLGCHSGGSSAGPRVDSPTTIYQAGTFDDALVTSNTHAHNVSDLSAIAADTVVEGADDQHGNQAPGGALLTAQLRCAGTNGCHGDKDAKNTSMAGIAGYHHKDDAGYKFLEVLDGNSGAGGVGVVGYNASNYTAESSGDHVIYTAGSTNGISAFCNNCHTDFHSNDSANLTPGDNTLWNRHPTDVALTSVMSGATVDYVNTPFAFTEVVATGLSTSSAYTVADGAQVMCLSCHRAHGSANADLLRFDYSTMDAGGGGTTGCLACHVDQR
jgi:predicted CXXCH cytochrome family protein